MKKKNIIIIIIVIALIALIGIGGLVWWGGKKIAERIKEETEKITGPLGEEGEEEEEEEEIYGIPLPKYPKMTKFIEQKDEETGNFSVMYFIEGIDKTEEIKNFYKTKLTAEGWILDNEMSFGEMLIFEFSKGKNYKLTLSLSYADGVTNLTLVYEAPTEEELKGPYESALEISPASGLNAAFHDDFKEILESIFGGAKLTSVSSDKYSEELDYIVIRKITEEDAQQVKDLLEAKDYVTTSTSADANKYRYYFSKEMLGETYDDISVDVWLEEEGSHQQKISIVVYKQID